MKKIISSILAFTILITTLNTPNISCYAKTINLKNEYHYSKFYQTDLYEGFNKKIKQDSESLHIGWNIGEFVISGFVSKEKGSDGSYTFMKNAGDKIKLEFKRKSSSVKKLSGNDKLYLATLDRPDTDIEYNLPKKDYGKGLLIYSYTDIDTNIKYVKETRNFLKKTKKDNLKKLVANIDKEGNYSVALDYRVAKSKIGFDTKEDYKIKFKFNIRNSNTIVFPKDVDTKLDLSNNASTENGFYLDFANSKDLEVNVQHKIINQDGDDWHVLSNKTYSNGAEFRETGLYTIKTTNKFTNADPTYCDIYVGEDTILKDFAKTKTISSEDFEKLKSKDLSDTEFLDEINDNIYNCLVEKLDNSEYFVTDISTQYISEEYRKELEANTQDNVVFGKTAKELAEIDKYKYIFDIDDNGEYVINELESDTQEEQYKKLLKDVSVGCGVIVVTATLSAITAGVPAVSIVLAYSAKGALLTSISSATIGATIGGISTYLKTKDKEQAKKDILIKGAEGLKTGAIIGAVTGGLSEFVGLKVGAKGGLSLNEVAKIQKETKWSPSIIKFIRNNDEYELYKMQGMTQMKINGNKSLVPSNFEEIVSTKENLARMSIGNAPLDKSGNPMNLHHIGQKEKSTLAVLPDDIHKKYDGILHNKKETEITDEIRKIFDSEIKPNYWIDVYNKFK